MKRKITVTTGTRSEYGLLRPILKEIIKNKKLELHLIVTGMHLSQKHGMSIKEIQDDGFAISNKFHMLPFNDSTFNISTSLGKGIINFSKIFQKIKPDINLILGDRDEALASTLAASHMNIPNLHIHGGDKTKAGIDEYNRHAITKISNIHCAATEKSKERIIKMGENPKFVFCTGSPSIDEIISKKILSKIKLEKKYNLKFSGNEILLLFHPVTTEYEKSGKQMKNILDALVLLDSPVIAIMPNSDAGNVAIFNLLRQYSKKYEFIRLFKNLPRTDYLSFLKNSGALIGNSSSGIIEASYFKIPVINVGIRQNHRERGPNVIDVTDNTKLIYLAIKKAIKMKKSLKLESTKIYGNGKSSKKIVKILETISLSKDLIQKQITY
jgi:UDP-N-acetylglucosamine 2-epimerase (non-hydrolysing)/GDP/UDP-N,N'-diacetylbacillosamine 2-epimerase (hydrolysing)